MRQFEWLEKRELFSAVIGTYSGTLRLAGDSTPHTIVVNLATQDVKGYVTGALLEDSARVFAITSVLAGSKWTAVLAGDGGVGTLSGTLGHGTLRGRAVATTNGQTSTGTFSARLQAQPVTIGPGTSSAAGALHETDLTGQHNGTLAFGRAQHFATLNVASESSDGFLSGTVDVPGTGQFTTEGAVWQNQAVFILHGTGAGVAAGSLTPDGRLAGMLSTAGGSGPIRARFDFSASPLVPDPAGLPRYDHVVVVMEENHSFDRILGSGASDDPFIQTLASQGASFTDSHAITHPSQPNYLALFSGSTQGVHNDKQPHPVDAPNLAASLASAGLTFAGYSESLPRAGFTGKKSGEYARKHNPWSDFTNVPASDNLPFSSFPAEFAQLPTVSFVVPNLRHDMHDGTVAQGDTWLQQNMGPYATWAAQHNSLLIVTWDENDGSAGNQIPTIFFGAHVRSGPVSQTVTHYNMLRTIEALYALPAIGRTDTASVPAAFV